MSLKKQALSGVFWTGLQQFGSQGIAFVVSVILARILLPEQFGLIAMIGVVVALGQALLDAGLSQSLIRTENPDQDDFSTVFYFNLVGSVVLYLIVYSCAPLIASFYEESQLISLTRWYSLIFITNSIGAIQYTRLTKIMDFKTQLLVSIPSLILGGLIGVIMALKGYGVWSLVASGLVQSLAKSIQLWIRVKWLPSLRFDKVKFKYHFNYGYKLTLSSILDTIFNNAYIIVIGKYFSPAIVGFYNRADTLKQLPVKNIAAVLNKVTFPLFSKIQNDNVRLKTVYKKIMQMVIFVLSPTLVFMAVLAEPLFRFLLTEKWLPAVPYFQILCFNGILYPIHAYNLNILKVKGRTDLFLKLEIIKKILIVLVIGISIQWGIYGLLYGSVAVSIIAFFINTHYSGKFIDFSALDQFISISPYLLIASVAGVCVYYIDFFLNDYHDLLRLSISSIFGILIYLFINFLLKMIAMKDLFQIIRKK